MHALGSQVSLLEQRSAGLQEELGRSQQRRALEAAQRDEAAGERDRLTAELQTVAHTAVTPVTSVTSVSPVPSATSVPSVPSVPSATSGTAVTPVTPVTSVTSAPLSPPQVREGLRLASERLEAAEAARLLSSSQLREEAAAHSALKMQVDVTDITDVTSCIEM